MAITQRKLTLEEFLRLPEVKPALEYIDGVVTQKVSPEFKHGMLQGQLYVLISGFAVPRRLAIAVPELRATFAGSSPVPDVAVYRWDRVPRDADGEPVDDVFIPPDIAIEIRSPGQSLRSQIERCRWYVDRGVPIALLVNRPDRSVRLFRPGQPERMLRGSERIDLDDVLPGFELTPEALFDSLRLD
jgi:Uma2 family endonuclease